MTLRLLVRAGAASDPAKKQGVAVLTSALLDQGTATRSGRRDRGHDRLDRRRAGTGAGTDLSYVNVLVMKDSLGLGFELLSDVVRNPAFKPDELERQREQAMSGLKVSYDDPDYVAGLVFDRLVYGFHPYGLPNSGTPESLQSLTVADLRQFHNTYYAPTTRFSPSSATSRRRRHSRRPNGCSATGRSTTCRPTTPVPPPEPTRRVDRRRQAGRRPDRAARRAIWRFHASIPTTWRST